MTSKQVSVIMGSISDWETMQFATQILTEFDILFEKKIVSAHRTPQKMLTFSKNAQKKGIQVIIAAAGGAAHLPGMVASNSVLPVIGVPVNVTDLNGLDALLSIVQMPKGVPVATMAIGKSGAINAALLAIQILALKNKDLTNKLLKYKQKLMKDVDEMNKTLQKK